MRIADIIIGTRHRKDMGDIVALAKSIDDVGLLHPVVVRPDGVLIAGERRIRAAQMLGWTDIPATIIDLDAVMRGEIAENVQRKDFAPSEAVAIYDAMERLKPGPSDSSGISYTTTHTRDRAAEATGMSPAILSRAKQVVEAAERDPEKYGDILAGMDETGNVSRAYQEVRRQTKRDDVAATPMPAGVYRVLYADPPWEYANSGFDQSAASHYPTMPTEDIAAMKVGALCNDQTVLFMWATSPLLPDALAVLKAWGFTYKASMVWDKGKAPGMGWFVQTQHEFLLIGTREANAHPLVKPASVMRYAAGEHSAKPHEVYNIIESMYAGPYCELFARHGHPGWEVWGNEIG